MISWRDLIVTDSEGSCGESLGSLLSAAPANLDNAVVENGKLAEWPGFFLSAPDEEPAWDTPREDVDWTGFEDAVELARR